MVLFECEESEKDGIIKRNMLELCKQKCAVSRKNEKRKIKEKLQIGYIFSQNSYNRPSPNSDYLHIITQADCCIEQNIRLLVEKEFSNLHFTQQRKGSCL